MQEEILEFQLLRGYLPDGTGVVIPSEGSRTVKIAAAVQGDTTFGKSAVHATGKVVQVGERPRATGSRQLVRHSISVRTTV